jgi:hypothetical protein
MRAHSDYEVYIFFVTPSAHMDEWTNDLDDVILTLISMVPKCRKGIKDISTTWSWFVVLKHIIPKHSINFPFL